MEKIIYEATTEGDCEGRSTSYLGYFTGDEQHIKKYLDNKKFYSIGLRRINILNVTPEMALTKEELFAEQKALKKRLEELDSLLS